MTWSNEFTSQKIISEIAKEIGIHRIHNAKIIKNETNDEKYVNHANQRPGKIMKGLKMYPSTFKKISK